MEVTMNKTTDNVDNDHIDKWLEIKMQFHSRCDILLERRNKAAATTTKAKNTISKLIYMSVLNCWNSVILKVDWSTVVGARLCIYAPYCAHIEHHMVLLVLIILVILIQLSYSLSLLFFLFRYFLSSITSALKNSS